MAFFAQREFKDAMKILYSVDKDGRPAKLNMLVSRHMQFIKDGKKHFKQPFISTNVASSDTWTFPSERAFKRLDPHRNEPIARQTANIEKRRHTHLLMQLEATLQRLTHGEKCAYYFSLDETLEPRELFRTLELRVHVHPLNVWGRLVCGCRDGFQSNCCTHSTVLSMLLWPDECRLEFSDGGAVLPPRKKNKRQKDGSFREDKSKGILKSTMCFADGFRNSPNANDLPDDVDDPLDKYLPLQNASKHQHRIVMLTSPT